MEAGTEVRGQESEVSTRERPPRDRLGVTHKVTLGEPQQQSEGHAAGQAVGERVDFYITLNRYPDGRPCEVFAKAGGGLQGWCDAICRLMSVLLQHGVPLETICGQLLRSHFAPCGMVPGFGFARSFPDYLARWIGKQVSRLREDASARQAGVGCQVSPEGGREAEGSVQCSVFSVQGRTDGTDTTEGGHDAD